MKFYGDDAEYQAAALKMAREAIPHTRGLIARRVTGDPGKSGMFQAYIPLSGGVLNSIGDNFHVVL